MRFSCCGFFVMNIFGKLNIKIIVMIIVVLLFFGIYLYETKYSIVGEKTSATSNSIIATSTVDKKINFLVNAIYTVSSSTQQALDEHAVYIVNNQKQINQLKTDLDEAIDEFNNLIRKYDVSIREED